MKMQALYGEFPVTKYMGSAGERVYKLMEGMKGNLKSKGGDLLNEAPEIQKVLLIDRSVDLITPFMTQLTYEGLVDEFFQIENSFFFFY
jgi:vacuolar protein sorting-associated protein 33A